MANNRKANNSAQTAKNEPEFTLSYYATSAVQALNEAESKEATGVSFAVYACVLAVDSEVILQSTLKSARFGMAEAKAQAKESVLQKVFDFDLSDEQTKPSTNLAGKLMDAAGMAAFITEGYVAGSGLNERILYGHNKSRDEYLLKVHGQYACTNPKDENLHEMVWISGQRGGYTLEGIRKNANKWANPDQAQRQEQDERRKKAYNSLGIKDKVMLLGTDIQEYDPTGEGKTLKGETRENAKTLYQTLGQYFDASDLEDVSGEPETAFDAFSYAIKYANNPDAWKDEQATVEMAEELFNRLSEVFGDKTPQGKASKAA